MSIKEELKSKVKEAKKTARAGRKDVRKFTRKFNDIIKLHKKAGDDITPELMGDFVNATIELMKLYGIDSLAQVKRTYTNPDKIKAFNEINTAILDKKEVHAEKTGSEEYQGVISEINKLISNGTQPKEAVKEFIDTIKSILKKHNIKDLSEMEYSMDDEFLNSKVHLYLKENIDKIEDKIDAKPKKTTPASKKYGKYNDLAKELIKDGRAPMLSISNEGAGYSDITKFVQWAVGVAEDGVYGNNTTSKVKEWQDKKGLLSDGIFGKKSWSSLLETPMKSYRIKKEVKEPREETAQPEKVKEPREQISKNIITDPKKIFDILENIQFINGKRLLTEALQFSDRLDKEDLKHIELIIIDDQRLKATYKGKETEAVKYKLQNGDITLDSINKEKLVTGINNIKTEENKKEMFINTKGEYKDLEYLETTTNPWYEDFELASTLIVKNKKNKKALETIIDIISRKTDKDIAEYIFENLSFNKGFNISALQWAGGMSEARLTLIDIITDIIKDPELDSRFYYFAMKGFGSTEDVIEILADKRYKESEEYRLDIIKYFEGYNYDDDSLVDWLKHDGIDEDIISKIIPKYKI